MTTVIYTGDEASVFVPESGAVAVRSVAIDLNDDLAERLAEQPQWIEADDLAAAFAALADLGADLPNPNTSKGNAR